MFLQSLKFSYVNNVQKKIIMDYAEFNVCIELRQNGGQIVKHFLNVYILNVLIKLFLRMFICIFLKCT